MVNHEIKRLIRNNKSDRLHAAHLRNVEIRHTDPTCFAFFLKIRHNLPSFLKLKAVVAQRPMHLIEIDDIHFKATKAMLAFLANERCRMIKNNFSVRIPTQNTFYENVKLCTGPDLQSTGDDFFGMAYTI